MVRGLIAVVVLFYVAVINAGQARQSTTVPVDYPYRTVVHWIKSNIDEIEESTGAEVVESNGNKATLLKETKYGTQVFHVIRTEKPPTADVVWEKTDKGSVTWYSCHLELSPLPGRRTEITVTMSASDSKASNVEVAVELRKSLRGMKAFFEGHLVKPKD